MSAEVVSSRFPVGPPAQPSLTCVLRPGADLENQPCLSRQHLVTITSYGREDWLFLGDADYAAQMVPRPKGRIDSTRFGWLKPILLSGAHWAQTPLAVAPSVGHGIRCLSIWALKLSHLT